MIHVKLPDEPLGCCYGEPILVSDTGKAQRWHCSEDGHSELEAIRDGRNPSRNDKGLTMLNRKFGLVLAGTVLALGSTAAFGQADTQKQIDDLKGALPKFAVFVRRIKLSGPRFLKNETLKRLQAHGESVC